MKIVYCKFFFFLSTSLSAQFTYKIKADSVKITNDSCSAELILENSTKNVKGFLYNYGNGRTEFRKGLRKLNDTSYIIGADTLFLKASSGNYINNNITTPQSNAGFWISQNSRIDARLMIKPPSSVPAGHDFVVGGSTITYGMAKANKLQVVESPYENIDYSAVNYGPSLNTVAGLNVTQTLSGSANILLQGQAGTGGAVANPMIFFGDFRKRMQPYRALQEEDRPPHPREHLEISPFIQPRIVQPLPCWNACGSPARETCLSVTPMMLVIK